MGILICNSHQPKTEPVCPTNIEANHHLPIYFAESPRPENGQRQRLLRPDLPCADIAIRKRHSRAPNPLKPITCRTTRPSRLRTLLSKSKTDHRNEVHSLLNPLLLFRPRHSALLYARALAPSSAQHPRSGCRLHLLAPPRQFFR